MSTSTALAFVREWVILDTTRSSVAPDLGGAPAQRSVMTSVGQRDQGLESGHAAVLGHQLLGSAAVVTGALAMLQEGNGSIPAGQRALLEQQVERNLEAITEIALTLIHGDVGSEPAER